MAAQGERPPRSPWRLRRFILNFLTFFLPPVPKLLHAPLHLWSEFACLNLLLFFTALPVLKINQRRVAYGDGELQHLKSVRPPRAHPAGDAGIVHGSPSLVDSLHTCISPTCLSVYLSSGLFAAHFAVLRDAGVVLTPWPLLSEIVGCHAAEGTLALLACCLCTASLFHIQPSCGGSCPQHRCYGAVWRGLSPSPFPVFVVDQQLLPAAGLCPL